MKWPEMIGCGGSHGEAKFERNLFIGFDSNESNCEGKV
jgi:hypothetical protein